jgi:hypothetical protein
VEISNDTGLPVLLRGELNKLETWIARKAPTIIALPCDEISAWKSQFQR